MKRALRVVASLGVIAVILSWGFGWWYVLFVVMGGE